MSRTTARRTSTRRGIRITVATGAAVLCAGAAAPALAHDAETHTPARHERQLGFAAQKERALRMLAHEAEWLRGLEAKVAGDDALTADQKAAFTTRLDRALSRVAAARTAVEDADTRAELRAALGVAELPYLAYPRAVRPARGAVPAALSGVRGWPSHHQKHRMRARDADGVQLISATTGDRARSLTVHRGLRDRAGTRHDCDGSWERDGDRYGDGSWERVGDRHQDSDGRSAWGHPLIR